MLALGKYIFKSNRTNNRGEFFLILYKITCIIFFAFLYGPEYLWLLTMILVLGAAYNYYDSKVERPYFNDDLAVLYNVTNAVYFYVNFVLFVCILLSDTDFEGGIQLFCVGVPLVALMEFLSTHPKYYWTSRNFESLDNEKDRTKYLRYVTLISVNTGEADNKFALEGYVTNHLGECNLSSCYLAAYRTNFVSKDSSSKKAMLSKLELYYYIRILYKKALKRFPNYPTLRINYAFFLLEIMGDPLRAQKQLKKAQLSHPRLDNDFVIFRYCRIIQESITENKHKGEIGMDRVSLIAYDNYFRQCKSKMRKAAKLHAEFWSGLNVQVPDLAQLIKISSDINRVIVDVEEYWNLMENLNANMPKAIRQYAKFLRDILGDEDAEREILKNIKQDYRKSGKDTESIIESEFGNHFAKLCSNDDIPYLLISAQQRSQGIIKAVNKAACRIFGYPSEHLTGIHMDKLVPPLFQSQHRKVVGKFSNNPDAVTFINKEKLIPCMLSNGYFLMMTKIIRALPSFSNDLNYVVTFKLDRNLQLKNICYLLVDNKGTIKSISESKFLCNY